MSDLIDRQAAIDAILHITNCKSVRELFEYNQEHHLTEMWSGGVNDAIDAVIGVESATDNNVGAKLSTLKIERAISGLTEWQKHVQTDSDIDRDISVAVKVLKAQLSTNLAEVGTDCISRQAAIDAVMECYDNDELLMVYVWKLNELPAIQPKRGKWIDKGWTGDWQYLTDGRGDCWRNVVCSECGESVRYESNFCPNCGAKMEVNHESN